MTNPPYNAGLTMFFDGPPKSAFASRGTQGSWLLDLVPPRSPPGQDLVFFIGESVEDMAFAQDLANAINDVIRKHSGTKAA